MSDAARTYLPTDRFRAFSNGTEHHMWLDANCSCGERGCRNYKPDASSSRDGCPMEVAIALASIGDGCISGKHALRCGLLVEGPGGTLVEPERPIRCPEYRGYDEPGPPRAPRPAPVDGAQFDMFDPRAAPAPQPAHR